MWLEGADLGEGSGGRRSPPTLTLVCAMRFIVFYALFVVCVIVVAVLWQYGWSGAVNIAATIVISLFLSVAYLLGYILFQALFEGVFGLILRLVFPGSLQRGRRETHNVDNDALGEPSENRESSESAE